MAFVHGKNTFISLGGDDLSAFTTTSQLEKTADSHDVTTYGKKAHVFNGGLLNGSGTISGIYDSTASTGPRAVINPLVGTVVELIRQPEGAGTGKPQDVVDVLVTKYTETNPVADMVTWSCDLQFSDEINSAAQPA
ncbi:hypothetical protein [Micromonospora zamorensis]|uniref:hypothetical protein n=1 Tax=Micromonospora zamorensis TaxID=709883 RepID=UPI0008200D19|nr:hypothetical protein [Micromonospora zamorensis]SCG38240.1 hypothetical protein GA0070619_0622 [Micromonospora zamorensis]